MSNAAREHDTMEQRLGRLERSLRRWRIGGVCAVLLGVATLALGQAPSERVVTASKFALVGPDGEERGVFMLDDGHPFLQLRSASIPDCTLSLGVLDDTAFLSMKGRNGYYVYLASRSDGSLVAVGDVFDTPRALMSMQPGEPVLALFDANGEVSWTPE